MAKVGVIYVYAAALLWSTIGPFSLGDPLSMGFYRLFFAAITSLPFLKLELELFLFSLIIFPYYISYVISVNTVGVTIAAALLYTAPAWVALVEKLRGRGSLLPPLLATLGVYLLQGSPRLKGNLFIALLPGILYALVILVGKELLKRYEPKDLLASHAFALIFLPPLLPLVKVNPRLLLSGLYLGAVCTTLAYLLFYKGLKEVEAWYASVAATLEPTLASLWGFLLGERLTITSLIGVFLIILSQVVSEGMRRGTR